MAVPKAPANFSVIRSEDRESMLLRWDPVTEDLDGAPTVIVTYDVYVSDINNGLQFRFCKSIPYLAGATTYYAALNEVQGVSGVEAINPDVVYSVKVRAVNGEGVGEFSTEESDY